jgi:hypothetical protein
MPYPFFVRAENAKDGAPHCVGDGSEIKSLGHPPYGFFCSWSRYFLTNESRRADEFIYCLAGNVGSVGHIRLPWVENSVPCYFHNLR